MESYLLGDAHAASTKASSTADLIADAHRQFPTRAALEDYILAREAYIEASGSASIDIECVEVAKTEIRKVSRGGGGGERR